MALTRIKAIVNMPCTNVRVENLEGTHPVITVGQNTVVSCNWNVPWYSSPAQFPNRRLKVALTAPNGTRYQYSIWQENFNGADRIRYNSADTYYRPDDPDPNRRSRPLASNRNGAEYVVSGDSDAILVIDEQPWVIMYRVGV